MFYIGVVSTLICGVALAVAAQRLPARAAVLETSGGLLLVGGLVLLGSQLTHLQ